VDPKAVKELDEKFPSTFNNYDYESDHVVITPNSPCPVLFGIRGDSVNDLHSALPLLIKNSETIDKWLIFKTNQGTDDHLILTDIPSVLQYCSVILTGRVSKLPYTISGGHVLFNIEYIDPKSALNQRHEFDTQSTDITPNENSVNSTNITCAAYEPTKGFRNIVKMLIPGDIVSVYGSVREKPLTINIEKLKINELVENIIKLHNPRCPLCEKSMKSIGHGKGYRCRADHQVLPLAHATHASMSRDLNLGFYEVPVEARRHLSKPLKRFKLHSGHGRD
jgi:tRNA(Ile2)-agmatinylcytidine synthase